MTLRFCSSSFSFFSSPSTDTSLALWYSVLVWCSVLPEPKVWEGLPLALQRDLPVILQSNPVSSWKSSCKLDCWLESLSSGSSATLIRSSSFSKSHLCVIKICHKDFRKKVACRVLPGVFTLETLYVKLPLFSFLRFFPCSKTQPYQSAVSSHQKEIKSKLWSSMIPFDLKRTKQHLVISLT